MKNTKVALTVGYARVSTDDQNLDLQIRALKLAGCDEIFTDSGISGQQQSRPGLSCAFRRLRSGDRLVVWKLDRLGRSLTHLVRTLEQLEKRNIAFHSITEHIDTASAGGRLVFHMMAALAEFERSLISERTRAGMEAAKSRGTHIGRRAALTPLQHREAQHLRFVKGWSLHQIANNYGIHRKTLGRYLTQAAPEPCRHE